MIYFVNVFQERISGGKLGREHGCGGSAEARTSTEDRASEGLFPLR